MSLRGNTSSLKTFSASLKAIPRVVAQKVASAAAPAITEASRATFEAGQNPYGLSWAPGVNGQKVTLRKSGALFDGDRYVSIGTKIRAVLGVYYAKYQIGKRPVFPRQGGALPTSYVVALKKSTGDVIRAELKGAA